MSEPQTLVQAALNRLSARLGSGLADAAAGLAVLAQDAPERLRQEWDLLKKRWSSKPSGWSTEIRRCRQPSPR